MNENELMMVCPAIIFEQLNEPVVRDIVACYEYFSSRRPTYDSHRNDNLDTVVTELGLVTFIDDQTPRAFMTVKTFSNWLDLDRRNLEIGELLKEEQRQKEAPSRYSAGRAGTILLVIGLLLATMTVIAVIISLSR